MTKASRVEVLFYLILSVIFSQSNSLPAMLMMMIKKKRETKKKKYNRVKALAEIHRGN
jgi:hypothetical protein